jgi:hypothetical protein
MPGTKGTFSSIEHIKTQVGHNGIGFVVPTWLGIDFTIMIA